jgi:hypothetical protein
MTWHFLRLQLEDMWTAVENALTEHSRTADTGWSTNLGGGRGANSFLHEKEKKTHYAAESRTRQLAGFHGEVMILRAPWPAARLPAFQEGLCSMAVQIYMLDLLTLLNYILMKCLVLRLQLLITVSFHVLCGILHTTVFSGVA